MNHTAATSAAPSTAAGTRALATAATAAATTSTKRPLSPKTAALEASATGKRAHLDGIDVPSLAHARSISSSSTAASASPLDIDMSSAPVSQETPQLVLTPLEQSIFGHVLACCAMFKLETQVRVAGGWVRDKLLGLESEDIDFALDNCTGEEFAGKLSEYLKSIGEKTSSIGVIKVSSRRIAVER
jgi:hypothetical protein